MADIVNRATTEVEVDGDKAVQQLTALEQQAKKYREAMIAANNAGDVKGFRKAEKELRNTNNQLRQITRSAFDVNKVMNNLSTAGPTDLKNTLRELNREINKPHIKRGSKQYNELAQKLRLVRAEMEKVRAEQSLGESSWSKFSGRFNKHFAMLGTVIASITGLSFAFRKLSEDVAQMDDIYADVMKTTNMTREQVVDLNEEFKKMDTRTSREQLNLLARDAGKLGLTSKKDILDFVEAGNQINVALGDDLGDGAIKNIGKLVDVFAKANSDMDDMDLKGKMLAVGSSINELGQSSTANEAYLVNFAGRLGGISTQAGISVQNILGYGSALDQNMQAVEMSATAFQKFVMKMLSDTQTFARIAKMELSDFETLLKTDINKAILTVLQNLGKKGGLQQLIPIFKDMGLDAARAASVISAMASNVEKISEAQKISNEAFIAGTSITDEYSVKNENLQAKLEKARKEFKDSALELGEHLNPMLLQSTNLMTYLVKILPPVIRWMEQYGRYIGVVVAVGLAYVAGVKLQVLWTTNLSKALTLANIQLKLKTIALVSAEIATHAYYLTISLLTGRLKDARRSFIALSAVIRANPFGAVLAIVTALAGAIYLLRKRSEEYNNQVGQELITANKLFVTLRRVNSQSDEARKIKNKIIELYGPYLKGLIDEEGNLLSIAEAHKAVNKHLREQISLKAKNAALDTIQENSIKKQIEDTDRVMALVDKQMKRAGTYNQEASNMIRERMNNAISEAIASGKTGVEELQQIIISSLSGNNLDSKERFGFFDPESIYTATSSLASGLYKANIETQKIEDKYKGIVDLATELEDLLGTNKKKNDDDNTDPLPPSGDTKATEQRAKVQEMLRKMEIAHNEAMNKIKQQYLDGEISSESERNAQLLSLQNKFDEDRKEALNKLIDTRIVTDAGVKSEVEKQISEIDRLFLDREIKRQDELKKILLSADPIRAEKEAFDHRLRELNLFGVKREDMTREQLEALLLLEEQHQKNLSKIDRPEVKTKIGRLNEDQANEASQLAKLRENRLISERQYRDQLVLLDIAYTSKKLQIEGLTEDQRIQLQRESLDRQRQLHEENGELYAAIERKTKLENLTEARDAELAFLDSQFGEELQLTENYEQAKAAILEKYRLLEIEQDRLKKEQMLDTANWALDSFSTLANSFASYTQAATDAQVASINQKYDAEIKAAGRNQKRISKIEAQRDKEIREAQREGNDRSFKIQIAMALASTAQSAINAYSSTAQIPIIGPVLAPVAAGVATAAGLLNVATIKKQHEVAAANYWTGGYTPKGYKYGYAGNVHFGEFVANQDTVNNPEANAMLRVIDTAQRNNTSSSLRASDFAQALEYREAVAAIPTNFRSGGQQVYASAENDKIAAALHRSAAATEKLEERLQKEIVAKTYYKGDGGIENQIIKDNKLKKNISPNG